VTRTADKETPRLFYLHHVNKRHERAAGGVFVESLVIYSACGAWHAPVHEFLKNENTNRADAVQ